MGTNFTVRAYCVFMFMLPLVFYSNITDISLLPRQLFLSAFALLLSYTAWKALDKERKIKIDAANLAMLIFLAIAALISLVNATVFSEALLVLSKLWVVVAFSILTAILLRTGKINAGHIVNAVIIFGVVVVATAVADITRKTIASHQLLRNTQLVLGVIGNKNLLSSIVFLCMPFLMIAMHGKRTLKIVSVLTLALAIGLLMVLRTRTVLLATIVFFGIVAIYYLKDNLKSRFKILVGALVSAVALVGLALSGVFGKLPLSTDAQKYVPRLLDSHTLSQRTLFWQNSLAMFREYPLGVGLGNFQIYFPKYGLEKFDSADIENGLHTLKRPHNDFLWVLCETGILGFAAYVSIFAILIYQSFQVIKRAESVRERQTSVYLFSGIVGFMIISFFDFPIERVEHLVVLMLIFALVIHRYSDKNNRKFSLSVKKSWVMLFIVIGICFSIGVGVSRFSSEKDIFKMHAARDEGYDQQVATFAASAESGFCEIDSKTIPLQWYQGVARFSAREFAESEICFEKAYALTPFSIHVINNLAGSYEMNGKRTEAITMYQKALLISPRFEEARLNLAAVYFNDKAYEKAFETIDRCPVDSRDPKYKTFLPPILKRKAGLVLQDLGSSVTQSNIEKLASLQDYSQIYYESKKNNITFESQIIKHLKQKL